MSIPAGTVTQSVLAGAVYLTRSLSVSAMAASVWPAVFTPNLRVVRLQEFVPPVSGAGSDPSMSRSRNFPGPATRSSTPGRFAATVTSYLGEA
jgi:hypothetical protein